MGGITPSVINVDVEELKTISFLEKEEKKINERHGKYIGAKVSHEFSFIHTYRR